MERLRVPSYRSDFRDLSEREAMARGRLPMRKAKKVGLLKKSESRLNQCRV